MIGAVLVTIITVSGCAMLADIALDQITSGGDSGGGINTELHVGDKHQTLGNSLEVKAANIGKVTGTSDNSVSAAGAEQVTVNNNSFPVWAIFLIGFLTTLIGYLAPRPQAWKRLIKGNNNGDSK